MKTYLDCIPCFFQQALEAARIAGANQRQQKKILNELAKVLPEFSLFSSPPEMGRIIYGLVKKETGKDDPFKKIKEESNKLVSELYNKLSRKVNHSSDKLLMAIKLAIAGNIIDYGVDRGLNVNVELKKILNEENKTIKRKNTSNFNYSKFKYTLKDAETILYLADNAGEVVFDRILIEEINPVRDIKNTTRKGKISNGVKRIDKDKKIIYAVKEKPIINDALVEDAYECGIDKVAEVISCGSDAPGTILSLCSKKFLKVYRKADMIISKGQGNFEALSFEKNRPIFFLFMAKCPVIAKDTGCNVGDIILLSNFKRKNQKSHQ